MKSDSKNCLDGPSRAASIIGLDSITCEDRLSPLGCEMSLVETLLGLK